MTKDAMKKTRILFFLCLFSIVSNGNLLAQSTTTKGLTETQKLGITAGTAYACHADKRLQDFELIVSYILKNKSKTPQIAKKQVQEYAQAKFDAYRKQLYFPSLSCPEILEGFYNLPLLKSVVYKDGTIKLPDGKIIKPQKEK